jgi:hypothetical protein
LTLAVVDDSGMVADLDDDIAKKLYQARIKQQEISMCHVRKISAITRMARVRVGP